MRAPWINGTQPSGELLVASERFSELAISTTLMLGVVFRLPLRQTEGFVRSLVDLMGCDLPVPDHTRAVAAAAKLVKDVVVETSTNKRPTDIVLDSHGPEILWRWRVKGLAPSTVKRGARGASCISRLTRTSSEIRTHELTGDDTADATMAGPLVAGSGGMIRRVFADGAYDGEPVTKAIREARPPNSPPEIIIPPRATIHSSPGHASWRIGTGAPCGGDRVEGKDELAETTGLRIESAWRNSHGLRVKRLNGGKLKARTFQSQQTEIAMQIDALNRSIRAAKPNTIRIR